MEKCWKADGAMKLVLCGCGRVHVTCGQMTLHFQRDEFLALADGISRVAAMVKRRPTDLASGLGVGAQSEVCH